MEPECCALAGTDCRPLLLRRRASRPQLKRDPLGCATVSNPGHVGNYGTRRSTDGVGRGLFQRKRTFHRGPAERPIHQPARSEERRVGKERSKPSETDEVKISV